MKHIVKRRGHTETYDVKKLYASIFAACLSVREETQTAEIIADKVCKDVQVWLQNKHEVTSLDITHIAYTYMLPYSSDAAWIYKHHRNIQ